MAEIQFRRSSWCFQQFVTLSLKLRLSSILERFAGRFPNSYLWHRTVQDIKGTDLLECCQESFPLGVLGIRVAFNGIRDVEPPYLHHNKMASYFEALSVIIGGTTLGFLITCSDLLRFLLNSKYFKYLLINYQNN